MAEDGCIPGSEEDVGLFGAVAGVEGCVLEVPGTVFSGDAFVARRGDHLGLTLAMRLETLEWWLPSGGSRYLNFFTEMPSRIGTGGEEADLDRLIVDRWVSSTIGARGKRVTADSIVWPAPGIPDAAVIVGWGIWDAAVAGDLKFFDFIRTADGKATTRSMLAGQRPGVASGELGLIL